MAPVPPVPARPAPPAKPAKPAPSTTYRPAPTSPKRRGAYSAYLLGTLLLLVGGVFIVDATLEDEPQSLTVAEGMADSVLTYSEWPLRFASLEECHDSPGLGRPGVMELDCDGESYGVTGLSGVDVKGGEEPISQAVNRAVRAIVFQDGVNLQSIDVLGKISEENREQLKQMHVKQLRVTDTYKLGEKRFVAVAFVKDPDAVPEEGADAGAGADNGAGGEPNSELEHSLEPDGTAPIVVVQMPVKSASIRKQLEEIDEFVRGVSLDDNAESAGESDV
ncbi:hypothetical protein L8V00_08695 [Corynebacterium sp. c8Ua_174]|uniref:Uncharacterized protein n=2 Tax=Corynebacterium evansiae TaxID=2913499 RepID=A0A9X3LLD9_9CORY|nr:hypothetical protein [Corynebacterium evansiae]